MSASDDNGEERWEDAGRGKFENGICKEDENHLAALHALAHGTLSRTTRLHDLASIPPFPSL